MPDNNDANRELAEKILKAIDKRKVGSLATISPKGRAHVANVLYGRVGRHLYVSTDRDSRKAENVATNPHVAMMIPIRRLPVGPPSAVQFQATAEVLELDDPELKRLADAGKLKAVTGHGEMERPGGCFIRITMPRKLITYGLGMSLIHLMRNPLDAAGQVELPA